MIQMLMEAVVQKPSSPELLCSSSAADRQPEHGGQPQNIFILSICYCGILLESTFAVSRVGVFNIFNVCFYTHLTVEWESAENASAWPLLFWRRQKETRQRGFTGTINSRHERSQEAGEREGAWQRMVKPGVKTSVRSQRQKPNERLWHPRHPLALLSSPPFFGFYLPLK